MLRYGVGTRLLLNPLKETMKHAWCHSGQPLTRGPGNSAGDPVRLQSNSRPVQPDGGPLRRRQ